MKYIKIVILICVLSNLNIANADMWQYLGGKSLNINHIVINPHNSAIIYASTGSRHYEASGSVVDGTYVGMWVNTDNYLFKSQNYGGSWTNIGNSLEGIVTSISVNPQNTNIIYIATQGDYPDVKLYKSENSGMSWTLTQLSGSKIEDFKINTYNPNILYMIKVGGAFFQKSTDGGETWNSFSEVEHHNNGSLNTVTMTVNPQNPDIIYTTGFGDDFSGGGLGGLYKTINQGLLWKRLSTPNSSKYSTNPTNIGEKLPIMINPHNPNIIYIGEPNIYIEITKIDGENQYSYHKEYFVSKSIDGGNTWKILTSLPENLVIEVIRINPHNPGIIYLGTRAGLYRSSNAGDSWNLLSNKVDGEELYIESMAIDPQNPEILYIGSLNKGLYKLTTDSNCLANYDTSTTKVTIPCLSVDNQNNSHKVELTKQPSNDVFGVTRIELRRF